MWRSKFLLFLVVILSVTLPLCAKSSNMLSQQYALSLSYITADISPVSGFMKTAVSIDGNDYTAGFRADEQGADLSFSSRLRFGREHGTVLSLYDTFLTEKDRLSFFTDIAAEAGLIPGLGNTYAAALSVGQELTLGHGFYQAGLSYEIGVYAHMTSFEGFRGIILTMNPVYGLTLSSRFGSVFFLDLSLITRTPFYYPKQTTYGFSLTSALLVSEAFSLGYDGYFILSDYIGETEFISRAEHTLFITWRFGL